MVAPADRQLTNQAELGVPGVTMTRLKAIAARWRDVLSAQQVILYGSFVRGEATIHSDVDVLFVAPTDKPLYARLATAEWVVRDLRHGLPLSPLVLTPDELARRLRRGDPFIQEIIATGIQLLAPIAGVLSPPSRNPGRHRERDQAMTFESDAPISAEWCAYARRDWRRVQALVEAADLEGAGFFLQQSLEKYLKAFLLDHGWQLRKTHVLNRLLDEAVVYRPGLEAYRQLCGRVSGYYLIDRYPGSGASELKSDQLAADAAESAALIRSIFPDEDIEPLFPSDHADERQ